MSILGKSTVIANVFLGLTLYSFVDRGKGADAPRSPTLSNDADRDLDSQLLNDLREPPGNEKTADKKVDKKLAKPESPLDAALRESLGGEDFGAAGEEKPRESKLSSIARQMRAVRQRLDEHNMDEGTREQQRRIASDLAAAIEELQKQCKTSPQSGGSEKSGDSSSRSKPKQPDNADGGKPTGDKASSEAPAKQSDPKLHRHQTTVAAAAASVRAAMEKAIDRLALPEKQREQMLDAPADEFLPNYEMTIKKYFQRLSEDESAP